MSARGWAGVVRAAIRHVEYAAFVAHRVDHPIAEQNAGRMTREVEQLRKLTELLSRLTPNRVERGIASAGRESDTNWQLCREVLRELSRGPAEQQETGR